MPKRKVDDYYNNIGISSEHYDDDGTYWFTSDNGKRIGIKKGQNLEQALDNSGIPDDGKDYSDVTASDIANQEDDSQDVDDLKPEQDLQDDPDDNEYPEEEEELPMVAHNKNQANKREEASKWDEIKKEEITDETKKWSYKFARSKHNTDKKKPRELQEKQTKYDKLKNFDSEIWDENNFESGKDVYTRDGMSKYKKAIDNKLGGNLKFIDEEIEEWLTDENHHSLNQAVSELKSGIKDGEIEDWWDNSNEESKAKVLGDISYWDNKERKEKLNQSYDDSVMQYHIRLMYAINKKTEGESKASEGGFENPMTDEDWKRLVEHYEDWKKIDQVYPTRNDFMEYVEIKGFNSHQQQEQAIAVYDYYTNRGGESKSTEDYDYEPKLDCLNCDGKGCGDCHGTGIYGESKYTIEDDFDESDQNDGEIQEKYVRGYEHDWKDKLDTWDGRAVSDNFTTVQPYDPVNPKYECIYCNKEFSWDDTFTHDGSHGTLPSPYEDMGNT